MQKCYFIFHISRLIHLAQKNLYIVIGLIAALAVLSILNILGALDYFSTSSEQVVVDLRLLAVLIVVLIPLVFIFTKIKRSSIDGQICLKEIP
jgi:uncharacterized membrane protein